MSLLRLAWRNLWRNGRRTGVTLAAMTLALLATILYTSAVEGYLRNMEDDILGLEVGDIQIHAPGYRDRPSLHRTLDDAPALEARLEREGFRLTSRLLAGALAATERTSAGAAVLGIDPASDAAATELHRHVARGAWLDPADPHGVVLGAKLAKSLEAEPGAEVVLLSQAADGSLANDLYTVRGVLASVSDATDRTGFFMTEPAFRELFVLDAGAHRLIARRPPGLPLEAAVERVRELAPGDDARSWRELLPTVASMMDAARAAMTVVAFTVYVAIAILIVNAMLMAVFERARELAVLMALGVGPGRIVALLFAESALLLVIAIGCGVAASLPGLWYLTRVGIDTGRLAGASVAGVAVDPIWRGVVTANTFAGPIAMLVAMVLAATLWPAAKAARLEPVEAMRQS